MTGLLGLRKSFCRITGEVAMRVRHLRFTLVADAMMVVSDR